MRVSLDGQAKVLAELIFFFIVACVHSVWGVCKTLPKALHAKRETTESSPDSAAVFNALNFNVGHTKQWKSAWRVFFVHFRTDFSFSRSQPKQREFAPSKFISVGAFFGGFSFSAILVGYLIANSSNFCWSPVCEADGYGLPENKWILRLFKILDLRSDCYSNKREVPAWHPVPDEL